MHIVHLDKHIGKALYAIVCTQWFSNMFIIQFLDYP